MTGPARKTRPILPHSFWLLLAVEAALAAAASLLLGESLSDTWLLGRSATRWALAGVLTIIGLLAAVIAKGLNEGHRSALKLDCMARSRPAAGIAILLVLGASAALFWLAPSQQAVSRLLPLMLFIALAAYQLTLVAEDDAAAPPADTDVRGGVALALLSVGLILLAAALPSRIAAVYNGLPWNSVPEFMLVAVALPIAALVYWPVLRSKWMLGLGIFSVMLKLVLMLAAPANGLALNVFKSPESVLANQPEQLYEGYYSASPGMVLDAPLHELRAFPIEWLNEASYSLDDLWVDLNLRGQIKLDGQEHLLINADGLTDGQASLTGLDGVAHALLVYPSDAAPVVTDRSPLPAGLYTLNADLVYHGNANYSLFPVSVRNDGAVTPVAFSRFWLPDVSSQRMDKASLYRFLARDLDLLMLVLSLLLPALAYGQALRHGRISLTDVMLALLAVLSMAMLRPMGADALRIAVPWVLLALLSLKALAWHYKPANDMMRLTAYLAAFGPALVLTFALFDLPQLRQLEFYPLEQDSLSYQIFARQIYLRGDPLALALNPHAYKFLFPYLAGGLHILFGQSSAAQFFLNAWCALLTSAVMLRLMWRERVSTLAGWVGAYLLLFLLTGPLLFIFYFRFGLIEPVAILCLTLTIAAAREARPAAMLVWGIVTLLLRLDYAGGVLAAVVLFNSALRGGLLQAWLTFIDWLRHNWSVHARRVVLAILPSLLLIGLYRLLRPDYVLNASDTVYGSLSQRLLGLLNVLTGGRLNELAAFLSEFPLHTLVMLAVLISGSLLVAGTLFIRRGWLKKIDLGWGLIFAGLLAGYWIVSPTGYSPRFSIPFMIIAIILISMTLTSMTAREAQDGQHDA